MRCGIDASNLVSGGGLNHIKNILHNWKQYNGHINSLVVWASQALCDQLPIDKSIELISLPDLNSTPYRRLRWQKNKLPYIAKQECDVIFAPGGIAGHHQIPLVSMCRNMLPFEMREAFRYGISYMLFRIFYLRILQARTFKNSSGVIFLCDYARDRVMSQIGDLSCETALIPHGVQSRFYRQSNPQRKLESFSIDDPLIRSIGSRTFPFDLDIF